MTDVDERVDEPSEIPEDSQRGGEAELVPSREFAAEATWGSEFLAACSAPPSAALVVCNGEHESIVSLDRPFLVIGRNPECGLHLDDESVALRHAYLQMVGGRLLCIGLSSRQLTHFSDGPRASGWIDPGDEIAIGRYRVRWAPRDWSDVRSISGDHLQTVQLRLQNPPLPAPRQLHCQPREQLVLVGRDPQCRIRIRHASVSNVHASLVLTPSGPWVVDLSGRNDVRINDEPVEFGLLREGDELGIGQLRFGVEESRGLAARTTPVLRPGTQRYGRKTDVPAEEAAPREAGDLPARMVPVDVVYELADRFTQLHESMLAHSQSQMAMMMQMFSESNAGMRDLLRDAFERVHEINSELRTMYDRLATDQARSRRAGELGPAPRPAAIPANDGTSLGAFARVPTAPEVPAHAVHPEERDCESSETFAPPSPDSDLGDDFEESSEIDSHARICRRISHLERERSSLWARIGSFLGQ